MTSLEDVLAQIDKSKSKWKYTNGGTITVQANPKTVSILKSYI